MSLSVKTAQVSARPGKAVKFTVTRAGDDDSSALTVFFAAVGSAKAGVDYKPLFGSVTILAGQTTAIFRVRLLEPAADGPPRRVLKLKLKIGDGYTPDTSAGKVKIVLIRPP